MSENYYNCNINDMDFNGLRDYCNQIINENSDLKKQIIQMNKLMNLLNANKLLTVFNDIKNDANFGISLIENYNSNKTKNIKTGEENNGSDGSLTEDNNNSYNSESSGQLAVTYLEQDWKVLDIKRDTKWKLTNERKRIHANQSKSLTTEAKRPKVHIIYNPPERILKTVRIGDQEFGCDEGLDGNFHCQWPLCLEVFSSRANLIRHYTTHGAQNIETEENNGSDGSLTEDENNSYNSESGEHIADTYFSQDMKESDIKEDPEWKPMNIRKIAQANESKPLRTCDYVSASTSHLRKYRRIHTGENMRKSVICDWPGCTYSAWTESIVVRHKRKHTGEKPFKCDWVDCGYSAAETGDLRKHKRIHTGEKKSAKCDWPGCSYSAWTASIVARHKRKHTGEKPFECDWPGCGYSAADSGCLRKHKRIHTGEKKSVICDWPGCTYSAWTESIVARHKRKHK